MSTARRLVAEAMRAGVVFQFRGDRLRMIPRRGEAVPAELVEQAKAIRADLISYLTTPAPVAEQARAVMARALAAAEGEIERIIGSFHDSAATPH